MGVYLSTTAYSPLAMVSVCIGFVSFVFTLGTFFRVVWVNLTTMGEATHEVHGYLTGLRTELLEEKASLRTMRKQAKKWHRQLKNDSETRTADLLGIELDDVTLKTMSDQIKSLVKRFRDLEKPFLEPGDQGIGDWKRRRNNARRRRDRDDSSSSPYYEHAAYTSPLEKGRRASGTDHDRGRGRGNDKEVLDEEELFWAQRTSYRKFNFKLRFVWLTKKSEAQSLYETLSRVQIRRIARQVGGMSVLMHEYGGKTCRVEEMLTRLDDRMNRIVGIRRVE